jgi:hypothetical protein
MSRIIYLHPRAGTEAYMQLEQFWELGRRQLIGNLAFAYPFHATLVSFFESNTVQHPPPPTLPVFTTGITGNDTQTFKMVAITAPDIDRYIGDLGLKSRVVGQLHITLVHEIPDTEVEIANRLIESTIDTTKWSSDMVDWTIVLWNRGEGGTGWKMVEVLV